MTGCKYYCKLVSGFSNTNCKLFLGRDKSNYVLLLTAVVGVVAHHSQKKSSKNLSFIFGL